MAAQSSRQWGMGAKLVSQGDVTMRNGIKLSKRKCRQDNMKYILTVRSISV